MCGWQVKLCDTTWTISERFRDKGLIIKRYNKFICLLTLPQGKNTKQILLLITNRKSHTGFRLIPTSMTLKGVIALILRFSPNSIALMANYVTVVEYRPIMSVNIVSQFHSSTFGASPGLVLGTRVAISDTARDLGVVIDRELSLAAHVTAVCRSGYNQLLQLRPVIRSLSMNATKTLVQAFISCHLDYCNSLLYGISDGLLQRL